MRKILIYGLLALLVSSCADDFLDTVPTNAYADPLVLGNTEGLEGAVNGMHRAMYSQYNGRMSNGGQGSVNIVMDVMGEDVVFPTTGNGWFVTTIRWQDHRTKTNVDNRFIYEFYYMLISNANKILDNVDNAEGLPSLKPMIKAQALAYRAFAHFYLVQLYAKRYDGAAAATDLGIPLLTTYTLEPQPRSTVGVVYKQIEDDLTLAASLIKGQTRPNKSHFSYAAVLGLSARVALTKGDYKSAYERASEARLAFTSEGGRLMTQAEYKGGFNSMSNPEWMWASQIIDSQTLYFFAFHAFMSWNFNSTNIRQAPKCINSLLYDQIRAKTSDVRNSLWEPNPTASNFPLPNTSYSRFPYMNRKFAVKDPASSVADVAWMRMAEMYLIEAEAKARAGIADAADVLYSLVVTRDPSYVKSTNTGQALIDEILIQRRIELWGEGFRFLDLKRLNQPLNREGSNHNSTISLLMKEDAGTVRWQFYFPQAEEDSNPFIKANQNP